MKIQVEVLGRETKTVDVDRGSTLKDVAEKLGLRKNEYIPVVDGKVVTWDYRIDDEVKIRLVPVVSGG